MFIPQEDYDSINKAVEQLLTVKGLKRLDVNLSRGMEANVYWAGTVIRIDIKSYSE